MATQAKNLERVLARLTSLRQSLTKEDQAILDMIVLAGSADVEAHVMYSRANATKSAEKNQAKNEAKNEAKSESISWYLKDDAYQI